MGLGAKVGSGFDDGECTGLGGLQDLLGRLNGKSSGAIEKERKGRDDLKRKLWAEQRYGGLGFVSGGLLVGDDVVVKVKKNAERGGINLDAEVPGLNNMSVETADGERLSSSETMASASVRRQASKTKRKRRSKVDIEAIEMSLSGPEPVEEKEVVIDPAVEAIAVEKSGSVVLSKRQRKEAKARRKAEKAERKLERRRKKEDKLCDHEPTERHPHPEPLSKKGGMAAVSTTTSTSTLPGEAPNAEPSTIVSSNRLAIRQRQIQQKKRSMLDSRALNEVLYKKSALRSSLTLV